MPRCKECRTKFKAKYFNQKYCLESDKCIKSFSEYASLEKKKTETKEWKKRKKFIKESLLTKKDYVNILQKVFNTWIRKRDEGKPCISCDKDLTNKQTHASHFFSVGAYPNLRFKETNVHSSCVECNLHLHGNLLEYDLRLPKRIGIDLYNELIKNKHKPLMINVAEVKELITLYKLKIKELN